MSLTRGDDVLGGEPRIDGTRLGGRHVATRVIDTGRFPAHVADQLDVSLADIYEALSCYYAHIDGTREFERENQEAFAGSGVVAEARRAPAVPGVRILLDERVGRVSERGLRGRGRDVGQAKDRFGEHTSYVEWCGEHDKPTDEQFEPLHHEHDHAGIPLYYDQTLPDADPEGLARTVDEVFTQYGADGVENSLVDLGEWYEWLHG